ncbi:hypothetical protein BZA77DRAFT_264639 [Pyronema omphalodes]|nr:hypothetical protein BZA77DRAFT_264639 [Pyronema omphalodes]
MSDPLSVAASIVGLIGLVNEVSKILITYVSAVKSAPEEATRLQSELTVFGTVLNQFREFLRKEQLGQLEGSHFSDISFLLSILGFTSSQLNELYRKLDKLSPHGGSKVAEFWEKLKWPMKKEDCEKTMVTLHRLAQCLQFSLQVSNYSLLSESYSEVMAKLETNQSNVQVTISTLQQIMVPIPDQLSKQSNQLGDIITILGEVKKYGEEIREISCGVRQLAVRSQEEALAELGQWLTRIEPQVRHRDISTKRLDGTGDWFVQTKGFKNWAGLNGSQNSEVTSRVFGCFGKPGAGKSIICSLVIDHLAEVAKIQKNTCLLWIYCDYNDESQQTPENMVGALLKQVLNTDIGTDAFNGIIKELQALKKSSGTLKFDSACKFLAEALQNFDTSYICIDALDEFKSRDKLLGFLNKLLKTPELKDSIRIFFTARPQIKQEIKRYFVQDLGLFSVTLEASKSDIEKFINDKMNSDGSGISMSKEQRKEIVNRIMETSDGMFLLPALQIQHVLDQPTIRTRREALESMPRELEGTFLDMIRRIESQSEGKKNQGLITLQWVLLSERQLTIEELRHAISIRPGDKQLDEEGFPTDRALLDCCLGLVIIEESTGTVRLVHKSLQDFFEEHSDELFPRGHEEIASICLTYMGFNKNSHLDNTKRVLHDYAIRNWGHHVRKSRNGAVASGLGGFKAISAILRDSSSNSYGYFPWFNTYNRRYRRYELGYIDSITESDIFHIPVHFGLADFVQYILENWTIDINYGFKYGVSRNQTPLLRAVQLGNNALVKLLLEKGADTEAYDSDGYRPLLLAAEGGNEALVRLLLDADADIEAQKGGRSQGTTALIGAASMGHYTIVEVLLDQGANVDSEAYDGSTALMQAVSHPSVVGLLLERGADPDAQNEEGYTALILGINNIAVMTLLLEWGADIEHKETTKGGTALSKAAQAGLDASVQFLLDNGADIESPDTWGRPPLYFSVLRGHESTIRLLLENGADPYAADEDDIPIWADINKTLRQKILEDENHFLRKYL